MNDKNNLDKLLVAGGLDKLVPIDGSINIVSSGGKKHIGAAISKKENNMLTLEEDGLFVSNTIEFSIEKQSITEDDFLATYKLKKIENGIETYHGDSINIPRDKVLQSAEMKTVDVDGVPYPEAQIGDQYIDMAFNDLSHSHIYVPLGDIGDDVNTTVKIDSANANGLYYVDGTGLALTLASKDTNGAMSKEMFSSVQALIDADILNNYVTNVEMTKAINRIADVEESMTWGELS